MNYYTSEYFNSSIFDFDYEPIAEAIIKIYNPASIIELGCGKGDLAKIFSKKGIRVLAIDGYANPDFSESPMVEFKKFDLNDKRSYEVIKAGYYKQFDLVISTEVAEHLDSGVNEMLADTICALGKNIIFSAAVPNQDGDGHINCQPKDYWHKLFMQHGFVLQNKLRNELRMQRKVAPWYLHNLLDYSADKSFSNNELLEIINRLVKTDSYNSSDYYLANRKYEKLLSVLDIDIIKASFNFRNLIKKLAGKKPVTKSL